MQNTAIKMQCFALLIGHHKGFVKSENRTVLLALLPFLAPLFIALFEAGH